ncbi:hypothetical protein NDU88_004464 [Pleurodeles waltl]|uniref:Uncharacterized protein n=1 Tax=Pleurodeles waltl TaxID=8319 RepID=A0AAV7T8V0_PLEWA|nr:hypothetical protein NDU88_004464 [Pleurodeles waltl]
MLSTIIKRYYFVLREQRSDELVEEYITSLQKLASTCKFGESTEEQIRDELVLSCKDDKIRDELWLKEKAPLEEVILVAQSVEHMLKCVSN